jgi:hypothetical protein
MKSELQMFLSRSHKLDSVLKSIKFLHGDTKYHTSVTLGTVQCLRVWGVFNTHSTSVVGSAPISGGWLSEFEISGSCQDQHQTLRNLYANHQTRKKCVCVCVCVCKRERKSTVATIRLRTGITPTPEIWIVKLQWAMPNMTAVHQISYASPPPPQNVENHLLKLLSRLASTG